MAKMNITIVSTKRERQHAEKLKTAHPNSLAVKKPELLKEWDWEKNEEAGLDPYQVTCGSHSKIWLICKEGHSYDIPAQDMSRGRGCPYCSGKKILKGFNDLFSTNPEIAAEWDSEKNGSLTPYDVSKGSSKSVWWKCSAYQHEWRVSINSRTSQNSGCPVCSNKKVLAGFNDLATIKPEIACEWNHTRNEGMTPQMFTWCSGKKVWWQCKCNHEWMDTIAHRVYGRQCPYCSGRKVLDGFNDLATKYPAIANEWNYDKNGDLTPHQVTWCSGRKVWWRCANNHEWPSTIAHRVYGTGCPYCCGLLPVVGETDLATVCPDIANQWHPTKNGRLTPSSVSSKSNKSVWWICNLDHEFKSQICARVDRNTGCPYCSNRKVLIGFNDLATTNPEIASEWHPTKNGSMTPMSVTAGSNKYAWWMCKYHHEWKACINGRTQSHSGCPYCSGRFAIVGETDLATVCPELALQWDTDKNGNLAPDMFTRFSRKQVWWKCDYGHSWKASIGSRKDPSRGCPYCNYESTVSFPEKAIFYYIKKLFVGAEASSKGPRKCLGRKSVDIWISLLSIAIEYDGYYWHKDCQKDVAKDNVLVKNGAKVFRIREDGCPTYDGPATVIHRESPLDSRSLDECIRTLITKICHGCIVDINTDRDRDAILSMVKDPLYTPELTSTQLSLDFAS